MLSADETLSIVVERDGEEITLTATPERQEQPDRLGGTHRIGVLGITAGAVRFRARRSADRACRRASRETGHIIDRTLTYIGRLLTGQRERRAALAARSASARCRAPSSRPAGFRA